MSPCTICLALMTLQAALTFPHAAANVCGETPSIDFRRESRLDRGHDDADHQRQSAHGQQPLHSALDLFAWLTETEECELVNRLKLAAAAGLTLSPASEVGAPFQSDPGSRRQCAHCDDRNPPLRN